MPRARTSAMLLLLGRGVCIVICAIGVTACGPVPERPEGHGAAVSADGAGTPAAASLPLRIASLSPALTQCVCELGAADAIIGRTPWCDGVAATVPVIGTLLDIDAEALVRCSPTLVIVQPPAQGMDPALASIAAERGWKLRSWRIDGIDDARRVMRELGGIIAAEHPSRREAVGKSAERWERELDSAMAALPAPPDSDPRRVLVLVGGAEGVAFGSGTYISDALGRMGCVNAVAQSGYPAMTAEDVLRLRPDIAVVVGASGPSDPLRRAIESAAPSIRVERIVGRDLLVPGGRLPQGLKELREAILRQSNADASVDSGHGARE